LKVPAVEYKKKIGLPPSKMLSRRILLPSNKPKEEWYLKLLAYSGDYKDLDNYIGIREDARKGWDKYDFPEPAGVGEYVSLHFPHRERKHRPGVFTSDFQGGLKEGWSWPVEVHSTVSKTKSVELKLKNMGSVPSHLEVYLYDNAAGYAENMRGLKKKVFDVNKKGKRQFTLLVGSMDYILSHTRGRIGIPAVFSLGNNYPNPFNPVTTIQYQLPQKSKVYLHIYNFRGVKLRTLVSSEKNPGYYNVRWDATDDSGRQLASGIYLYNMHVIQENSGMALYNNTKKLAILK